MWLTFRFIIVIGKWNIKRSQDFLSSDDIELLAFEDKFCGIPAVFKKINEAPHGYKYDKRMTGSSCIDDVIQEVII